MAKTEIDKINELVDQARAKLNELDALIDLKTSELIDDDGKGEILERLEALELFKAKVLSKHAL